MILRNTAGQSVLIGPLLLVANGAAVTSGATIKTRIGGTTASGAGTLTHISGGVWEYAPTQAETDTAVLGLVLEGTSATSVPLTVPTTRFPAQTAGVLPAVASGSSGGVPLIGSSPLTNLDAAVSSRSTYAGGDTAGTTTLLSRLTSGRATNLDNLDAAVSSRLATAGYTAAPSASDNATAVWASGTRTLTATIPSASDNATAVWAAGARTLTTTIPTASDNATAVWGNATRELTSGANLSIPTTADIADAVWDETQSGHTTAGTFGDYLDAAISGVSGGGGPSASDIADAVWDEILAGHAGAGSAGAVLSAVVPAPTANDNATAVWASASRTLTTPIPTTAQIADGILGRNVAGGSDGGRTVKQALYALRNKVTFAAGTMTVYDTDDVAAAWTGAYTTDAAAEPIVGVDPS